VQQLDDALEQIEVLIVKWQIPPLERETEECPRNRRRPRLWGDLQPDHVRIPSRALPMFGAPMTAAAASHGQNKHGARRSHGRERKPPSRPPSGSG
jgi:hypothetical protein